MSAHTSTLATFGGDVATQASPAGVITSMLKEYLPYELLFEELMKRDYLLTKVAKDQSWKGGELSVPFMGGRASSFAYGELTAVNDITEDRPVRGKVSEYREIWGSMIFHQKDLDTHTDMAQSFLKILPDRLEDFIDRMKEAVSVNLLNGPHFDAIDFARLLEIVDESAPIGDGNSIFEQTTGIVVADSTQFENTALQNGYICVKRPSRFQVGQYVTLGFLDESLTAGNAKFSVAGYVKEIDLSMSTIQIVDDKDVFAGTTSAVDLRNSVLGVDLALGDKVYLRGVLGAAPAAANTVRRGFTSLRSQLLSPENGGSANLFGIPKKTYPHLQAVNIDGSGISSNMLGGIFDAYNTTRQLGKGAPTDVIMSYANLALAMKQLEEGGGGTYGREFTAGDSSANAYGWTSIKVSGVVGSLTLVGVHEMDDDVMYMMDWRSLKLFSNGFFERRQAPDGKEYYEERTTAGYKYVIDTRFYGELILSKPSHCGIIHSVN